MSDNKEFITYSSSGGSVNISEDVIASLAAGVVDETEGIYLSLRGEGKGLKNAARKMRVRIAEDNSICLDLYCAVDVDTVVSDAARKVQLGVKEAVESATGQTVSQVNVHVGAVVRK